MVKGSTKSEKIQNSNIDTSKISTEESSTRTKKRFIKLPSSSSSSEHGGEEVGEDETKSMFTSKKDKK